MKTNSKPPASAIHIWGVKDLPQDREPATYEIQNSDAKPRVVTVSKRQRQVLDLLMQAPVYCASPVRVGDTVHIMKREIGLDVHTEMYPGDATTGSGDYGVYFLRSKARRLSDWEVAA